jgi:mRNA interferase HigB
MAIKFRKNAIKFLEKANLEDAEKIQEKISQLLYFVEEQAIIPFTELDIKKMKGDWEGFIDYVLVKSELSLQLIPNLVKLKFSQLVQEEMFINKLYPDTKNALSQWYQLIKDNEFSSFVELRQMFPSADQVGKLTVFNIGGNKVRLIAAIHYNRQKIYIRAVLTHSEYDEGKWKE